MNAPSTKLHHVHCAATSSRLAIDDLSQLWRGEGGDLVVKRAVAERLATCWNVLEGFPTEALADGIIADIFGAIDAGDIAAAQALVAKFDARLDLTPEGNTHDCAPCLAREDKGTAA